MTSVCLGVGCERKPNVLFRLARKPLLLFRHGLRIYPQKSESVESITKDEIIQLSRLRLPDCLQHFVEPLQGKQAVEEITEWGGYRPDSNRRYWRYDSIAFSNRP